MDPSIHPSVLPSIHPSIDPYIHTYIQMHIYMQSVRRTANGKMTDMCLFGCRNCRDCVSFLMMQMFNTNLISKYEYNVPICQCLFRLNALVHLQMRKFYVTCCTNHHFHKKCLSVGYHLFETQFHIDQIIVVLTCMSSTKRACRKYGCGGEGRGSLMFSFNRSLSVWFLHQLKMQSDLVKCSYTCLCIPVSALSNFLPFGL